MPRRWSGWRRRGERWAQTCLLIPGINVGDIVEQDGDIFGDGVNIAARLESIADPGGVCVSARVQEDAAGKTGMSFEDLGEQALKNIARPIHAYRMQMAGTRPAPIAQPGGACPTGRPLLSCRSRT